MQRNEQELLLTFTEQLSRIVSQSSHNQKNISSQNTPINEGKLALDDSSVRELVIKSQGRPLR